MATFSAQKLKRNERQRATRLIKLFRSPAKRCRRQQPDSRQSKEIAFTYSNFLPIFCLSPASWRLHVNLCALKQQDSGTIISLYMLPEFLVLFHGSAIAHSRN